MTGWKNIQKKTLLKKSYVRVVDDEEDVRTSMALLLRLAGIDVRTYESAADLLENGEFETPGCLVLDIRMPGMDGLRLQETLIARHIIEGEYLPNTVVKVDANENGLFVS